MREWLKGLAREERHIIGEDLLTVQHAWPVGKPLVDHLGDGVWELRSRLPTRVARTLFMLDEGAIVVLHGFIKKTRKTPARERQRQYEEPYD